MDNRHEKEMDGRNNHRMSILNKHFWPFIMRGPLRFLRAMFVVGSSDEGPTYQLMDVVCITSIVGVGRSAYPSLVYTYFLQND